MTPAEVASLERQTSVEEAADGATLYRWRLVAEGMVVDLAAVGIQGYGIHVQWMGAHGRRPFTVNGEDAELHHPCKSLHVDGWCAVDASRGDRLVAEWDTTGDEAPIWAALEALAEEVAR